MNRDERTYDTEAECAAAIAAGKKLVGKTPEGMAVIARLTAEREQRMENTRNALAAGRRRKLKVKR